MNWQERRKLAYLIYEFDDVNLPSQYIHNIQDDELISMIVNFFKKESLLIYPAKSYFVAIVYAHCLQKYFDEDFYTALNNKDLIIEDIFFVPYNSHKHVYDQVLEQIGSIDQYDSIQKTIQYFKQEFLIGEQEYGTNN